MYEFIAILRGNNKELAKSELSNLWKTYLEEEIKLEEVKNTLIKIKASCIPSKDSHFLHRLAYTHYLGIKHFHGHSLDELQASIDPQIIKKNDGKTFSIRTRKAKPKISSMIPEKSFAPLIWDMLENPKVNLDNPEVEYSAIYFEENSFYFCEKIFENKKKFLDRMPKKRPAVKPYTLKSDIARGCINLLNSDKGLLLDPFCGIGGVLLEGYDMGFEVIGNDISWNDLKYTQQNFDYFFPEAKYYLTLAETEKMFIKENSIDGIVTDIPYGKSCRMEGDSLYKKFVENSHKMLKKKGRMVVVYATFIDFKEIAKERFNVVEEIEEYINKSMVRKILVLEK